MIHPDVRLGHVHLKVADLEGAFHFYCDGVELYWDRPTEQWPRTPDGELAMYTRRLDLEGLLGDADP